MQKLGRSTLWGRVRLEACGLRLGDGEIAKPPVDFPYLSRCHNVFVAGARKYQVILSRIESIKSSIRGCSSRNIDLGFAR
jgi:hypothetical protein